MTNEENAELKTLLEDISRDVLTPVGNFYTGSLGQLARSYMIRLDDIVANWDCPCEECGGLPARGVQYHFGDCPTQAKANQ